MRMRLPKLPKPRFAWEYLAWAVIVALVITLANLAWSRAGHSLQRRAIQPLPAATTAPSTAPATAPSTAPKTTPTPSASAYPSSSASSSAE